MIRPATLGDVQNVTDLWNHIIVDTDITFTTVPKTNTDVAKLVVAPDRLMCVAQSKSGFAGFALISPFRDGPGYAQTAEHSIYVTPDHICQGIGSLLFLALETATRDAGYHVMVAAINAQNTAAITFHERHGFLQVGNLAQVGHKNGHWHDLVLMQKIL